MSTRAPRDFHWCLRIHRLFTPGQLPEFPLWAGGGAVTSSFRLVRRMSTLCSTYIYNCADVYIRVLFSLLDYQYHQQITMSKVKVIIVGGGLSGLSAAHTVLERGGNVVSIPLC